MNCCMQILAKRSFSSGVRGVLKLRAHILEHGDYDELQRTIEPHGRQIEATHRLRPREHRPVQ